MRQLAYVVPPRIVCAAYPTNERVANGGGRWDANSPPPPQQPPAQQRTILFALRVQTIKIEALRFFLQLYLVGRQNDPVPRAWTTQSDATEDHESLQVYYLDGTGMLSIQFSTTAITLTRCGDRPSLPYRLQESLLLHGLLDELADLALDSRETGSNETGPTTTDRRLFVLQNTTDIDLARQTLPARKLV